MLQSCCKFSNLRPKNKPFSHYFNMNLIIDIGNTAYKVAIYNGNQLIYSDRDDTIEIALFAQTVNDIIQKYNVQNCIMSSVKYPYTSFISKLDDIPGTAITLDASTPLPIINRYSTPQTLGCDRIAAAVGATVLFPGTSCLIIDAGTAITYDYVKDGTEYLGGNISPGIDMRFMALNQFTSRLPMVSDPKPTETFGLSTTEAISNGVINGVIHEINGYIDDFEKKNVNSRIILTGGGSIYLSKKLKNTIFAEPNLVTIGLNRILNYNVLKEN